MTSSEKYSNVLSGATTLSAAITTTSATTCSVVSAAQLPTSGQFRVRINTEIMLCTGISGTTLTIVRGYEGTTAATHLSGSTVNHIVTAGSIIQANKCRAKFPASSGFTFPDLTGYSWLNQDTGSTITTGSNGTVSLYTPTRSGYNLNIYAKSVPTTPYTITVYYQDDNPFADNISSRQEFFTGLGWYCNSGAGAGKLIFCYQRTNYAFPSTPSISIVDSFSSVTTRDTQLSFVQLPEANYWMRITDDGTNRTYYISRDGLNFITIWQSSSTYYIIPTHVGIIWGLSSASSIWNYNSSLISLKQS